MDREFDAIILGGGTSSRMKLESQLPKQVQIIYKNQNLLHYQANWLRKHGAKNIIIAINDITFEHLVEHSPETLKLAHISNEKEKLGTAGAVKLASEMVTTPSVYVMNVDDLVLSDVYTPQDLVDTLDRGYLGSILTSRGKFPYGIIKSRGWRITKFDQKPMMDYKVNSGHYAFSKSYIRKFPDYGNYEDLVFPQSVKDNELTFLDLDGKWITVNTWKELKSARKAVDQWESRKLYGSSRYGRFRGFRAS